MIKIEQDNRKRKPWVWTDQNKQRAADVKQILDALTEYLPLTLRAVFYRLISAALCQQAHWLRAGKPINYYSALGRLIKWMRIADMIQSDAIIDEQRVITTKAGFTNPEDFLNYNLQSLGRGYSRCNAQKQSRHVEVWLEKATMLHIVEPVADEFCRRVVCCKGYQSITFQTKFYERATEALGYGMIPTVLYFGDWDPSGCDMLPAAMHTLSNELGLVGVEYYRCGINPEHFSELTADPVPIKPEDTRSKKFIAKHGTTAYELDALHPARMQELVRESIIQFTDMGAFQEQNEQEKEDIQLIRAWAADIKDYGRRSGQAMGIF